MEETIIPWDFLGILLLMVLLVLGIILCVYALKARSRTRLQDPRKDHVYRERPSRTKKERG